MPDDDAEARSEDLESRSLRKGAAGDTSSDTPSNEDDDEPGPTSGKRARRKIPVWAETGILLVVALAMALVIKTLFVQAFYIPSESMEPGLQVNDRILVEKWSYWFGSEHRGDVIVFEDPGGWLTGPEKGPQTPLAKGLAKVGLYPTGGHLVKRVIGIAGDTVSCCDDEGRLMVNGKALDEDDFIAKQDECDGPMVTSCMGDWSVTVPDDRLFVMGDNRAHSADSSDRYARKCNGPKKPICDKALVPTDLVVGKVFALVWPIKHATFIGDPDVFDDVPERL